jgi:hypothetical protein
VHTSLVAQRLGADHVAKPAAFVTHVSTPFDVGSQRVWPTEHGDTGAV